MFTDQIHIKWMCYNCFILWCVSGSKAPLACIWHEEQFCTAGPLLQNGTVGLADGKPWVSVLLSCNGFTMPTCVAFLAFGLSTNAPLMLITIVLLYYMYVDANNHCTTFIICTLCAQHHE